MKRWLALLIVLPGLALAQDEDVSDTLGKHTVQSGDTLWNITGKYLGDDALWKENWRLNPHIEDPNRLRIGEELTVITERKIQARSAVLRAVANQVDKSLQRNDWQPAQPGDKLAERDSVRTRQSSSAELEFSNAAMLRMGEYSQIFLQEKRTSLRGVDQGKVEITRGGAELIFAPMGRRKTEIEIIAGSAVTRPRADANGRGRIGAGTDAESGRSRVMVYSGESSVVASGQTVELPTGTGSAVPKDGPPSPPEKLLKGPKGLTPTAGADWKIANMPLSWQALTGADHYLVDICADEQCGILVRHSGPVEDTRWQPQLTDTGEFFWRVRAVSASGLEGYPSVSTKFTLATTRLDVAAPTIALVPAGPTIWGNGVLRISGSSALQVEAFDPGIGVKWIEIQWPGGEWERTEGATTRIALASRPAAASLLKIRASDHLEQVSDAITVAIEQETSP